MIDPRKLQKFFEQKTLGSPNAAIGFVLWRVVHRFQRDIDRALLPLDLTHLQFTILALLAWSNCSGEPVTQAELARSADIEPMQISQVLKALEMKGLIERRASASNARAKVSVITEAGLAALGKAMPIAMDIQRRMFGENGLPRGKLLRLLLDILQP